MPRFFSLTLAAILAFLTLSIVSRLPGAYAEQSPSDARSATERAAGAPEETSPVPQMEKQIEAKGAIPAANGTEDQDREDERDVMEKALDLLDASQDYWVKGDLENALDSLDQAYALLLDTNGEPDISRQKDDLRLLIAKKILAIYTSMQTVTAGKRSEIPAIMNSDVEKEIRSFQTVERDFFIESYRRSAIYRSVIQRELKNAGLPEELSWLPLVESGFKVCALSRARALGLWQFIPSTGYKYGLNRDDWIDERMDLEKSTKAAIGYLRELHGMFGDWLTVLAAYNCGEGRVLKVISLQHLNYLDRFWDLYHQLPYETARYVPRFLATLQIIKDPKKYGIELDESVDKQIAPLYEIVKTNKSMRLQDIAQSLNTSEESLCVLNPELRYKATPDREYNLRVPPETAEKLVAVVDNIPAWEKPQPVRAARSSSFVRHRVKKGETMASIAKRYRTSAGAILACNDLSVNKEVITGQSLLIPVRSSKYAKKAPDRDADKRKTGGIVRYTVKRGDTLASVARNYGTTITAIKQINRFKSNTLKAGQVIRIAKSSEEMNNANAQTTSAGSVQERDKSRKVSSRAKVTEGKSNTAKKGETERKIARKNNVSVD